MNIEILAFIIIPIIAWGLIVHTLLYRDRNRVYEAWEELHGLLEKRLALTKSILKETNHDEALQKSLDEIDNNVYLPKLALQHQNLIALMNSKNLTLTELDDLNTDIEQKTQWYNAASKNLNVKLESFPDMLIAKVFGFHSVKYFTPIAPEKELDSPIF